MEGKQEIVMGKTIDELDKYEKDLVPEIDSEKNQAKEPEKAEEEMNYPRLDLPEGLSNEEAKEKQAQILAGMLRIVKKGFEKRNNKDRASSEPSPCLEGQKDGDAEA